MFISQINQLIPLSYFAEDKMRYHELLRVLILGACMCCYMEIEGLAKLLCQK